MTTRKLTFSSFYGNTRVSQTDRSTLYLHLVSAVSLGRNHYALVCQSQPLLSFGSDGLPDFCPACGVPNPLQGGCEC